VRVEDVSVWSCAGEGGDVSVWSRASEGGDVSVWSTTSRVWSHDSSCTARLVPHWVGVSLWVWGVWYGSRNAKYTWDGCTSDAAQSLLGVFISQDG